MLTFVDESLQHRRVQRAWIWEGARWRAANCAWVADYFGAMRKDTDCISAVSVQAAARDYLSITVTWSAPGARRVVVYVNGTQRLASNSDSGSTVVTGLNPNTLQTVKIIASTPLQTVESQPTQVTTPNIPPPSHVVASAATNTEMTLSWPSVEGAAAYLVDNADSGANIARTTATSIRRGGLAPSTSYRTRVRSQHASGATSAPSPVNTASTTARFTPGTYDFYPAQKKTWQLGAKSWKTGNLWHGDGGTFGASGGSRLSFFGEYRRSGHTISGFFATQGAVQVNVVGVQVLIKRTNSSHGIASAQSCLWWRHQHDGLPGGAPSTYGGGHYSGTLNRGEAKWVSLPLDWGRELVSGAIRGVAWGGTSYSSNGAGYMYGPVDGDMGVLRISVG